MSVERSLHKSTYDEPRVTGHPAWFDLTSPDVTRAAAFYHEVFGWAYGAQGADYGNYHMAYVEGRVAAGMGQPPEGSDLPAAWTVYYAAEDVDALTEDAKARGATAVSEPFDVLEQGRMAVLQDPTGAVFGLWQAGVHIGAGISEVHGAMAWCEVNTPDAEAAGAFYGDLFGATAEVLEAAPSLYYVLKKGQESVGGILQMDEHWEGVPPHWMVYFEVADTDAAAGRAEAAGGHVCVPPFDTPFGRIAVLDDPLGATFSVVQPTKR